jgi:Zn-dependent protease
MNNGDPLDLAIMILTAAPVFLFALVFHEYSHALVAWRLGDRTAAWTGRLTMDPRVHLDPVGSIAMPLIGIFLGWFYGGFALIFGWAKPVPFNPSNLKNPIRDTMFIAMAGPISNLLLLMAFGLAMRALVGAGVQPDSTAGLLLNMAAFGVYINGLLALFNMIPLPPLDGSKILGFFLPAEARHKLLTLNPTFSLLLLLFLVWRGLLNTPLQLAIEFGAKLAGVSLHEFYGLLLL